MAERSAFDLPDWCSQVYVRDIVVSRACSLPPVPQPSIVVPPPTRTVVLPPPVDFCQCINIKPVVSLPMKPAASVPCITIPPETQSFVIEEGHQDCCSGWYRLKIFIPISCALAGIPTSTETTGAWIRKPQVPPPPAEHKPKARLVLSKDCEVCAITNISIPIEVPCIIDEFKDTNVQVKIVEKKKKSIPPVQNSVAEFDVPNDDCAIGPKGIVLSIEVPEGCAATSIGGVVRTKVKRGRPSSGTTNTYDAKVSRTSGECDFKISFPDIEIPVPGCPRTSMFGSVVSKPSFDMSVFTSTVSTDGDGTDCKTNLKVRLNMPKLSGEFSGVVSFDDVDDPTISGGFSGGGRMRIGKLKIKIRLPKCNGCHNVISQTPNVHAEAYEQYKFRNSVSMIYDNGGANDTILGIAVSEAPMPKASAKDDVSGCRIYTIKPIFNGYTTDVRYMDGGEFLINDAGVLVFRPHMHEMKFVKGLLVRQTDQVSMYASNQFDIPVISTTTCSASDDD